MKQYIYADNAATTQLDPQAFEAMIPWLRDEYGNASQPYSFSRKPKRQSLKQELSLQNASMQTPRRSILLQEVLKAITGLSKALRFQIPVIMRQSPLKSNTMPCCIHVKQLNASAIPLHICRQTKKDGFFQKHSTDTFLIGHGWYP